MVFDVPEDQRDARDALRAFLKECGFRQFQQSIWVSRNEVAPIILKFVKDAKLQPWVEVLEGKILS